MLLAQRAGDMEAFEALWAWTRQTLSRPTDALTAWRFLPNPGDTRHDPNNATDGDLFLAWALAEAGARWNRPEHTRAAQAIARDILRLNTREIERRLYLLPGAQGFQQRDAIVVNPSYYVFPAFAALERLTGDARWARLRRDGLELLDNSRFGRWGLPADWVRVPTGMGRIVPAPGFPARFAYDAVRVPLYLAWAGNDAAAPLAAAERFWLDPGLRMMPAWADLRTDAVSHYPASSGTISIARLTHAVRNGRPLTLDGPDRAEHYYAASLCLLVREAAAARDLQVVRV
jgi:endoglucanase